ncbi:type II secretion system minor pseudopilin GspI [Salinisphaera sp. LB1]|uniref:type II secretion system minor pseudopilin GspI n=1 Tax=Salinisphaera sp. LB1 TaxID=2183911 RepID=UPI000D7D67CC|nr:type II secretion system minor pseudopilin GspI [Salinisphaera sp. LB1]AWN17307.1 General secretion pathway protein I [Salinisphaera sp. LB1]
MKQRAEGFTLIEVLIALAVIAIALVAFVSAGAQNADYATYIHQRTIAQIIARNRLVEYQIAANWPSTGTRSDDVTMAGSPWHWQTTISGTADASVRRADVRVYAVDPDTHQADKNSITLLSGFLTQHQKPTTSTNGHTKTATSGSGS